MRNQCHSWHFKKTFPKITKRTWSAMKLHHRPLSFLENLMFVAKRWQFCETSIVLIVFNCIYCAGHWLETGSTILLCGVVELFLWGHTNGGGGHWAMAPTGNSKTYIKYWIMQEKKNWKTIDFHPPDRCPAKSVWVLRYFSMLFGKVVYPMKH